MLILGLFVIHWYASLFFQSLFNHRYAAHQMFKMSPFWEKTFFIGSWIANGSSYLSPTVYGILHRMHHAYADTELDPHSPKYDKNIFAMMWRTRAEYLSIAHKTKPIDPKFTKNMPEWVAFDRFAEHIATRIGFGLLYVGVYALLATAWWQWLLLPMTIVMGPLHGAVINWFAHKIGYTNFELKDTSKNFLPVDFLMWGESYHNNHHKNGSNPNFGHRWFEFDPMWPVIKFLNWVGIIRLRNKAEKTNLRVRFTKRQTERITAALARLPHFANVPKIKPERRLGQLVNSWKHFVDSDWKGNLTDYFNKISVREELEVIMQNANGSLRRQIASMIEPFDKRFQSKMKPVDMKKFSDRWKLNGKHFWQTHTIFQGELA
ncbi:MAG: acyl-CoA desaturase [Bacteroidetes bacterium]|nr:acyl-CoA desaturase [Bacteroidota bacterium]MBP6640442.1 acyl-CoA desaturase [Bacteroidia bacterium]MBP6722381.1 acyl-CoA desaturase [Bacteroidia bacterium]